MIKIEKNKLLYGYMVIWLLCFLVLRFFGSSVETVLAVECEHDLQSLDGDLIEGQFDRLSLSVKVWDINDLYAIRSDGPLWDRFEAKNLPSDKDGWLPTQSITTAGLLKAGAHHFSIINEKLGGEYCRINYSVAPRPTPSDKYYDCRLKAIADDEEFKASSIITIEGSGLPSSTPGITHKLRVRSRDGKFDKSFSIATSGNTFSQSIGSFNYNTYDVILRVSRMGGYSDTSCQTYFTIDPDKGEAPTPRPTGTAPLPSPAKLEDICKGVANLNDCIECIRGTGKHDGHPGMWTAIGCIPTDISAVLKDYIFVYGIGIAGGIAFLLILFGGFTIMTSAGNPENMAKGKEMITSAIAGLLIIIFSVAILRLIGVDILKIPGFK